MSHSMWYLHCFDVAPSVKAGESLATGVLHAESVNTSASASGGVSMGVPPWFSEAFYPPPWRTVCFVFVGALCTLFVCLACHACGCRMYRNSTRCKQSPCPCHSRFCNWCSCWCLCRRAKGRKGEQVKHKKTLRYGVEEDDDLERLVNGLYLS